MPGRPIRLVTTAVLAALAAAASASAASAGCYTCGYAPTYVAPPVDYYAAPCGSCASSYVAPPVTYASPCGYSPCGTSYAPPQPAYRVDLGPTYTQPVATTDDETEYATPRAYRYVSRGDEGLYDRSYYYTRRHATYGYRFAPRYRTYDVRDYRYRALRTRLYGAHVYRASRLSIYRSHMPMSVHRMGPHVAHARMHGPMPIKPHYRLLP
jgi:hypothetical protein